MIKTARQLKDLIRNLSKNKSADAQILMRNYMMERFLERISLSEYRDKFILKGGMLVAAMVGLDARSTVVSRATTNTRMRDFYDLHILSQLHGESIIPADLRAALIATARKRSTENYLADAPAAIDEIEADPNMEKLWQAYQKKFAYANDLSWHTVMESIRSLYGLTQ